MKLNCEHALTNLYKYYNCVQLVSFKKYGHHRLYSEMGKLHNPLDSKQFSFRELAKTGTELDLHRFYESLTHRIMTTMSILTSELSNGAVTRLAILYPPQRRRRTSSGRVCSSVIGHYIFNIRRPKQYTTI